MRTNYYKVSLLLLLFIISSCSAGKIIKVESNDDTHTNDEIAEIGKFPPLPPPPPPPPTHETYSEYFQRVRANMMRVEKEPTSKSEIYAQKANAHLKKCLLKMNFTDQSARDTIVCRYYINQIGKFETKGCIRGDAQKIELRQLDSCFYEMEPLNREGDMKIGSDSMYIRWIMECAFTLINGKISWN